MFLISTVNHFYNYSLSDSQRPYHCHLWFNSGLDNFKSRWNNRHIVPLDPSLSPQGWRRGSAYSRLCTPPLRIPPSYSEDHNLLKSFISLCTILFAKNQTQRSIPLRIKPTSENISAGCGPVLLSPTPPLPPLRSIRFRRLLSQRPSIRVDDSRRLLSWNRSTMRSTRSAMPMFGPRFWSRLGWVTLRTVSVSATSPSQNVPVYSMLSCDSS